MSTETKTLYVFMKIKDGKSSVCASTEKFDSTYCSTFTDTFCSPICEMNVEIPVITDEKYQEITDSMLESLVVKRSEIRASLHSKIAALDERIQACRLIKHKRSN